MKMIRMVCVLFLLLTSALVIFQPATVLAQEETPPPEKIELTTSYTKLEGISGTSFEFEVDLNYQGGSEARVFDLMATVPKDWIAYITPTYPKDKQILDIRLEPTSPYETRPATKIVVYVAPYRVLPEPGEYPITVEVTSGEIKGTINLTAVVTATYIMSVTTPDGRLNTTATAGRDNYFSVEVINSGSAAIDNITFSSSKPSGWTIEFSPDEIDSMDAMSSQTIEVNIKPPAKTIAGDYEITLKADGKEARDDIDIRVTVETPTIWGWVGVGIVVLVIAGLAFIFMRFSRR